MNRFVFLIFVILSFITSCKKSYVLKGRLYNSCGIPSSQTNLSLKVGGKNGDSFDATTDLDGFFEIPYEGRDMFIRYIPNIISDLPSGNVDIGNVYTNISYSLIVSLSIVNPLTSNDTIEIKGTKYPGPFQSGILDTIDFLSLNMDDIKYGILSYPQNIEYKINLIDTSYWNESEIFNVEICSIPYYQTALIIE